MPAAHQHGFLSGDGPSRMVSGLIVQTRRSSSAPGWATIVRLATDEETPAMRTSFSVNDMTIHRIVEQESGFTPMLDFLPTLSKETLGEDLAWLAPGGHDSTRGNGVF